ncbi:hypothetical protein [Salinicola sp. RZ23]|uniref:hypothetical protein n=1 Tax=Salinicola sp. RZ23 TaxID=1949087 RepID=UPI0018E55911|nr:hypothetical protein [Salinicola sp. RZ23]
MVAQRRAIHRDLFKGEQGKRDSTYVVAQLGPKSIARSVDRWQELERQVSQPPHPQRPQALAEAAPEVAFANRV